MENENLLPMLRLAKEKGCLTGLTTNGIHLTEDFSRQLLTAGLDSSWCPWNWLRRGFRKAFLRILI